MSLRRNRNCKPVPVPASAPISTDRLADVLRLGLCVGAHCARFPHKREVFLKWEDIQGVVHSVHLYRFTYFDGNEHTSTSRASDSGGPELKWTTEMFWTTIDLFTQKMWAKAMVENRPSGSWNEAFYNEAGLKHTLAFWVHSEQKWYVLAIVETSRQKGSAGTHYWHIPYDKHSPEFRELLQKFEEFVLAEADEPNGPSVWLLNKRDPQMAPP